MGSCQVVVFVRFFIKSDLFDNIVPFDNTTPIYLINLALEIWVRIEVRLRVILF